MSAIKALRKRHDWSQKKLAEETGITQAFLCEIENGAKNPSIKTAAKLARALGCTVDELIGGDGDGLKEAE